MFVGVSLWNASTEAAHDSCVLDEAFTQKNVLFKGKVAYRETLLDSEACGWVLAAGKAV